MQSMDVHPKRCPIAEPRKIIVQMIVNAAMAGAAPMCRTFLKLNSSPSVKSRMMTPTCPQISMLSMSCTEGMRAKCGLQRNPAAMYPSTTGCLSHLNRSVTVAATSSMSARSLMSWGIVGVVVFCSGVIVVFFCCIVVL